MGGGTLDVTLLELENDDIRVEAHSGIMHLGGEDFDNKLMEYCINQFKNKTSIDLNKNDYIKQKNRLKMHCEKAKIDLTFNEETEIEIESIVKGKPLLEKITRKKFEYLCESLFISMINPIKKVLEIAEEDKINIDEIILVGGSTRIPKIKEILEEFFEGNININNSLNPDEAVAYGATIECALEMGLYNQDISLLDVCPFSLGVATTEEDLLEKYGLVMEKVIKKGTKLPFRAMRKYTPVVDYQKEIAIKVYEGENKYVNDNFFLGKFVLENIPKKKKDEINIEITFDLDENSILTVTAFIKENKETKSIIIKNDKGDLSELEIKIAKEKNKKEKKGNLKSMKSERNYKKEIYNLINQVNNSTNDLEKYYKLNNLKNTIEGFIEFFSKNITDNLTYKEKMHYYLTYLFNTYSCILEFPSYLTKREKNNIIFDIKNYLKTFEKEGIRYCPSLVKIFINNNEYIFEDLCIEILGFYSQRGTELYSQSSEIYFLKRNIIDSENEKIYSKYYLEEALSINDKFSLEKRMENNETLKDKLNSILDNCKELINLIKAESIKRYSKSFSSNYLIDETEFTNEEQRLDILDKFQEAISYLAKPKNREEKLLKAIYLANIIKIEYKIFKSNNYNTLLKMIEDCLTLKCDTPFGCESPNLNWFKEICNYKNEIEEKKKKYKEDPKGEEEKLKKELNKTLQKIENKFQEGKFPFFYYILTKHEPNGLDEELIFKKEEDLKKYYKSHERAFINKLRRLYNPQRYKGDNKEERKNYIIMKEISTKLNNL